MAELLDLWLPIIVSAAVVFIASALAWMVLPHHKPDWKTLPDQQSMLDKLRSLNLQPALYMFPCCGEGKNMKDPEFRKMWEEGPHGVLMMHKGKPNFARNLLLVFIFYLVVGLFVAYVGTLALEPGAAFRTVFRVTGTVAVMAYVFGGIPNAIFFGRTARSVLMDLIDGFVYGILTGLIFAWLWP
ncbi:MAG: hypothetical protein SYC29_11820 [Planctomycetota bacterium]|nr:hypothetical protein [Planctomycetota bacterium]